MAEELSEKAVYKEAKKRVKAKKDFYRHLGTYLVVNTVLIIIWALSDADLGIVNMWFLWPLCIWGAFVFFHFLQVFAFKTSVGRERADIEKEVERIKKEQGIQNITESYILQQN